MLQKKQLNIAIVAHNYPPHLGGVEIAVYEQAHELVRRGHNVTVITAGEQTNTLHELSGLTVQQRKPMGRVGNMPIIPDLLKIDPSYDAVIAHLPYLFGAELTGFTCFRKDIPLLLFYHASSAPWFFKDFIKKPSIQGLSSFYLRYLSLLGVRKAQGIACITEAQIVEQTLPIKNFISSHKPKTFYIPNGIDEVFFEPALAKDWEPDTINFLWCGRLDHSSGPHFKNIQLAFDLLKIKSNLQLTICGDGPEKAALTELVRATGLSDRIDFIGGVDRYQMPAIFADADFFLNTSVGLEGLPLTIMEALASGCPVIAADISGMDTIMRDKINGFLFEPRNLSSLREKVDQLEQLDLEEIMNLREQARQSARKFTWSIHGERLEKALIAIVPADE